jgi:allantoicase
MMSEEHDKPSPHEQGEAAATESDTSAAAPPGSREDGDGLRRLNALPKEAAAAELLKCCGSTSWVRLVAARRPFRDERELFEATDRVWWSLNRVDWLEAFSAHPKIGERKTGKEAAAASDPASPDAGSWPEEEQSAALTAARETLTALSAANRVYEEKFGFIYIVCATGKSADEMLMLLERRLDNDSETELCVAAEEQRRITQLRLRRLLNL